MPTGIPTIQQLTPALLASIVSAAVSLLFRFIPRLRKWFDTHDSDWKQSFMLIATVAIGGVIGLYNMAGTGFSQESLTTLAFTVLLALTSNSTTYNFTKRN